MLKVVVVLATISFDKNVVINEPEAIEKLVEVLISDKIKPINKKITSDESMARGEEILKRCLYHSKDS